MKKGFSDVLIGLQYGDEGKAKVIDLIAREYEIIARFNGGANAGHTIETSRGRVALHQIPSGIFCTQTLLYIGSGCVINLEKIVDELKNIARLGISLKNRLHISDQATVVQPHHIAIDEIIGATIGTTKNGIGPAYADRALRMEGNRIVSIRLADLLDEPRRFFNLMKMNFKATQKRYGFKSILIEKKIRSLRKALRLLIPYLQRDTLFLQRRVESGARVLFEGAQSCMLDVGKGLVPYVTSSATVAGSAYVGGDLSPRFHRKTIGVAKAIMSRVGNGPFVSEFGGKRSELYCAQSGGNANNRDFEKRRFDPYELLRSKSTFDHAIALRILGGEYGTVTGRPRRIGMLDIIQLRYAVKSNGVDKIFLTKCDLLKDFSHTMMKKIPVVIGYILRGKRIDYVPASQSLYRAVQPVVEMKVGFSEDIRTLRTQSKLPKALCTILDDIMRFTGARIYGIGVGPKREEYVWL